MQNCLIDRGSAFDCDALVQGGIGNYIILINKDDLDDATITYDTGTTEEITDIQLASTKQGWSFEGSKESNIIPNVALRGVDGMDGFDHTIDMKAFDVSQVSRLNLSKMRFNKVACIVPLLSGKALLFGRDVGLRLSDYQENPGDASLAGLIQFILKTPADGAAEIEGAWVIASTFDLSDLLTPEP